MTRLISIAINWAGNKAGKLTKKGELKKKSNTIIFNYLERDATIRGVIGTANYNEDQLRIIYDNAKSQRPERLREYLKLLHSIVEDRAFYDLTGLDYVTGEIPKVKAGMALAVLRENI
ncbi:hypothetical protein AUJ84_04180 [Candidatus Pacearchaeota archaeon CG1_02_32_132]|nr:MAG: hypothetical protein AUJ84_04180 [Candidatus Pacearchaeota archaeon CG1_02_32_132]